MVMKLLLADDHALFRDALLHYIMRNNPETEIYLACDLNEVFEALAEHDDINLILLDYSMPGAGNILAVEKLRRAYPHIPVALMSGVAEVEDVERSLDAGAAAFFPKTMTGRAMMEGLEKVARGDRFVPIDHNTNKIMLSHYGSDDDDRYGEDIFQELSPEWELKEREQAAGRKWIKSQLTRREAEVLSYLVTGLSNKEIAQAMGIQTVTVKLHMRGICRKFQVKNRTQAALLAVRMGIDASGDFLCDAPKLQSDVKTWKPIQTGDRHAG